MVRDERDDERGRLVRGRVSVEELGGLINQLTRLKSIGATLVKLSANGDVLVTFANKIELPSETLAPTDSDDPYYSSDD